MPTAAAAPVETESPPAAAQNHGARSSDGPARKPPPPDTLFSSSCARCPIFGTLTAVVSISTGTRAWPCITAAALALPLAVAAADWPRFRGFNGAGISDAVELPIEFGPDKNVVWKTETPLGKSSPVIVGSRIFLTAHDGGELLVLCLDRPTGRELWRRSIHPLRSEDRHKLNDAAAPTPVSDGTNLYALFYDFGLVSYGPDGEKRWETPLGPFENGLGMAASPILVDGRIIVVADQSKNSYIAAFDPRQGELLWKTRRIDGAGSFATPIVHPAAEGSEIIVSGQKELAGYSASRGERLWRLGGFAKLSKGSPVVHDGVAYVNVKGIGEFVPPYENYLQRNDANGDGRVTLEDAKSGKHRQSLETSDTDGNGEVSRSEYEDPIKADAAAGGAWAVRIDGRGELGRGRVLWRHTKSLPNVPSPLYYDKVVYLVRNGGIVTSIDPVSGAVYKKGRIPDAVEEYYSSPVAADGKIFALSQRGKISVLKAGPQWEVLATSDLGEEAYATPAFAGNFMYLRTATMLYCFARTGS